MDWFMWDLSGTRIFLYSATLKLDLKKRAVELLTVEWMRWFRGGFQMVCWFEVRSIPCNWLKKTQTKKKTSKTPEKGTSMKVFRLRKPERTTCMDLKGSILLSERLFKDQEGPSPSVGPQKKILGDLNWMWFLSPLPFFCSVLWPYLTSNVWFLVVKDPKFHNGHVE